MFRLYRRCCRVADVTCRKALCQVLRKVRGGQGQRAAELAGGVRSVIEMARRRRRKGKGKGGCGGAQGGVIPRGEDGGRVKAGVREKGLFGIVEPERGRTEGGG